MNASIKRLLSTLPLLLLVACGGGGGGSGGGGDDNTGNSSLVYSSPEDGATDVSVNIKPTIYLSEGVIECGAASTTSFSLATEAGAIVNGAIECDMSFVRFTPDAPLASGTKYVASVSSMQDEDGAVLCEECVWTFTTAAAPTFTVDHAVPAGSATEIAVDTRVTVTFSGPANCATVSATTFNLVDASAQTVAATVACSGAVATLTPNAVLKPTKAYTASLAATVMGANGVALDAQNWTFTTSAADKVYVPAPLQPLSSKSVEAAGADGDGNVMLLYRQRVQSNGVFILSAMRYKRSIDTPWMEGWYGPWSLWDTAGSSPAKIAMSRNGNALVLGMTTNGALNYAYYNAVTNSWAGKTAISVGNTVSDFEPNIDDNGNAMAVWAEGPAGSAQVYARYYNATSSTLGAAQAMGDGMWPKFLEPRFAFDADGNGTVVFAEWQLVWNGSETCGIASRNYNKSTDTWSALTQIVPNGHAKSPDIAFDGDGNAVIVWAGETLWDEFDASTAYWLVDGAIRAAGNDTWVHAHLGVGWDPKGDASNPHVVILPNGDALATWTYTRHGETVPQLNAAYHAATAGQEWSPLGDSMVPVPGDNYSLYRVVGATGNGGVSSPSLVVDQNGQATLVYSKSDGTRFNVYSRTFSLAARGDGDSGWSESLEIDSTNEDATVPVVAAGGDGMTTTIWNQWNPGNTPAMNDFWYLRQ